MQAWYRRGKANASLENYGDAVRDLHVALNMEQSLNEKKKIENELKSVSYQHKDTLSSQDRPNENKFVFFSFISLSTIRMEHFSLFLFIYFFYVPFEHEMSLLLCGIYTIYLWCTKLLPVVVLTSHIFLSVQSVHFLVIRSTI